MKVLHYADDINLSWGETWLQLLGELSKLGVDNFVACRAQGTLSQRLEAAGVPFDFCRPLIQQLHGTNRCLGAIIDKFAPDIIHTRLSSAAAIGGWWGKKKNVTVIQTLDKYGKLKYHVDGDFFVACSSSVRDYFVNAGGDAKKIEVIYNPIDVSKYELDPQVRLETRRAGGVFDETPVILGAGRFVKWKGFDVLIKAFELASDNGVDANLWLVGGGEDQSSLEKLAKDSRFSSRIKLFPFVKDIRPYMQAADLFVLPSKEPEPFGIVLLEAMASDLPVIATRRGGPLDILTEDAGQFAEPDNAEDLSRAIKSMLSSREALRGMGEACRRRAQDFDVRRIAEETVKLYEDVLSNEQKK